MKKVITLIGLLTLVLTGAALADTPGDNKESVPVFIIDEAGNLHLSEVLMREDGTVVMPVEKLASGQACNGGSCHKDSTTLNCPTSGGPVCEEGKECVCACVTKNVGADGGGDQLVAVNRCV